MSLKISTSYFAKASLFKPWQIPVSIASLDPPWFHFGGELGRPAWIDPAGRMFGSRLESLVPVKTCPGILAPLSCSFDPASCGFLRDYAEQLEKLDLEAACLELAEICFSAAEALQLSRKPEAVLLVHEAPSCPCSQRFLV